MPADLATVVAQAARRLEAAGLASADARGDATLLARWVFGWDQARWLTDNRDPAPHGFEARFDSLITRRVRREPVAYLIGEREFYGRPFEVTPDTLIPRPETEFVIEEALAEIPPDAAPLVVDVGTGSGILAITVALERPHARITATDISAPALAVARRNAQRHGVLDRIDFRHGELLARLDTRPDIVVSNPPYVAERDRASLSPDVRDFEPASALFAGDDGLEVIRALVPAAAHALAPRGRLIMEFGAGQVETVAALAAASGLRLSRIRADLQGHPRVVVAGAPGGFL